MRECKRWAEGGGRVIEDTINVNQGIKQWGWKMQLLQSQGEGHKGKEWKTQYTIVTEDLFIYLFISQWDLLSGVSLSFMYSKIFIEFIGCQ